MKAIEKVTRASHLIDMDDIIREGNPTLRAVAEDVTFPLSDQEIILGEKNDAILAPFSRPCYG
ncbi:Peptide deformylase [Streptococcus parasanguinis]|nr:Peptide deformylase [Streptococcus parasanguinis]